MRETKNLLIIGGTGFIGRHLVLEAVHQGYKTTVLSLHCVDNSRRIQDVDYYNVDITNHGDLEKILADKLYTHVVNLGGYISHVLYKDGGRKILDAHFLGLQNLVELLNWSSLKSFVQIGSSDEYGDVPAPQCEEIREKPISSYSFGKLAASQFLQMLHRTEAFPAVILRLFLVYGPGQDNQRFLPQIINGCLNGETFATSHGQQLRDFCHVDDITKGIMMALENEEANGEVINLASGKPVAIREVIELVQSTIAQGTPLFGKVSYRPGENMALYADVSKAKKILKWVPEIEIDEGVRRTINFYKDTD